MPAWPPPRSWAAGRWPARPTRGARPRSRCPNAAGRPCGRRVTPLASRSRCRSPATGGRTRRCAPSSSTSSRPPSPTTPTTSTGCGGPWPSSTASRRSARSCPCYGACLPPRLIRIYPGAVSHASMGVAVDLGTTSVVVYLLDFATGRVVDSASAYNKQIACGEDVISRIIYTKRKRGLEHLQNLAVETINDLLAELQQRNRIKLYEIHEVAVAGNTTMTHLLLGLDPQYLRAEPYIPTLSAAPKLVAGELGLHANMLARVHVMPSVGSYVGGDITAGVISSGMFATDKLTLFIDIGTNGEMVLGTKDWLLSCACSAGPAFEGGGAGHGMRASAGAIEDVFIADDTLEPTFRTIDDAATVGICGSGLIDLLGELFVTGLVDKSGHLDRGAPTDRIRVRDGVPADV